MNATKTVLWNATKRTLSLMLIPIAFAIVAHTQPLDMNMVKPEHGKAAVSDFDKAVKKANKKCEPLPDGEIPGAVVIDYKNELPRYSTNAHDVDNGFNYAVEKYMGVKATNKKIEGVNLCV